MTERERGLLQGAPSLRRRTHLGWNLAIVGLVTISGCSLIGNLGQFDGAVAADAAAEDAAPDAPIDVAEAGDETTADVTVDEASLDAGADATDASDADAAPDSPTGVYEAGVCGSAWPDGGTNLVADPDFLEGGAGWTPPYGGNITTSTVQPYCGPVSGELSGRTAFYEALGANIPPTAGTYNVVVWVRHDAPAIAPMDVGGICTPADAGQAAFTPVFGNNMVPPNTWTLLSGSLTFPAGCASMVVFVGQPSGASPIPPDLFADDMYVSQ